jgi:hypothetical protein
MTRCLLTVGCLLAAFAAGCGSGRPASGPGAGGSTSTGGAGVGAGGSAGATNTAGQSGAGGGAGAAMAGGGVSGLAGSSVAGGSGGSSTDGDSGGGAAGVGADAGAGMGTGCAGKPYKLCEDFESGGAVGAIPSGWTTLKGFSAQRGGVGLSNDQAHSGTMALKSEGMNTGMDRVQKSLAALGTTATKHWGRVFYKVQSPGPKPNSGVIHLTLAALQGTTENRIVDTVVSTNGTHQWLFNIPDDSCCSSSSYNWMFDDAWHCAEWTIDVGTESFRFFSDGKEVTQLAFTGKTKSRMSDYTSIGLGTIFYQTPPKPIVVWFDDLAIDDNQIGCQ